MVLSSEIHAKNVIINVFLSIAFHFPLVPSFHKFHTAQKAITSNNFPYKIKHSPFTSVHRRRVPSLITVSSCSARMFDVSRARANAHTCASVASFDVLFLFNIHDVIFY